MTDEEALAMTHSDLIKAYDLEHEALEALAIWSEIEGAGTRAYPHRPGRLRGHVPVMTSQDTVSRLCICSQDRPG